MHRQARFLNQSWHGNALIWKVGQRDSLTVNIDARNKIYSKENTCPVFVIKDLKFEIFGIFNMSVTLNEDGFIGLSPKI